MTKEEIRLRSYGKNYKECIILSISVQAWRRQEAWQHTFPECDCGMEKLDERQWSVVWQENASETEGKSLKKKKLVRPVMLYGAETWATTRGQEARLEVNEMRMLRWMCGITRMDKIRNEHIRGTTRVAQAYKKITENDCSGTAMWGEWKRST